VSGTRNILRGLNEHATTSFVRNVLLICEITADETDTELDESLGESRYFILCEKTSITYVGFKVSPARPSNKSSMRVRITGVRLGLMLKRVIWWFFKQSNSFC
jgi:hypothetical protein